VSEIDKVPSGDRWLHEIKFDGYRVQLHIANNEIKVFTRRGNDWTKRFRKIGGAKHATFGCVRNRL
jgi:bifunctional non-homologous end joining protein LigD